MKGFLKSFVLVLVAVLLLAGCTQATVTPSENPTEEPAQTPAYEGYLPQDSEEYKLFGGMQLWYSGFGVRSSYSDMSIRNSTTVTEMTEELDQSEEYPFLRFQVPAGTHEDLYVGVDAGVLEVDLAEYSVVKLAYRSNSTQTVLGTSVESNSYTHQFAAESDAALVGDEEWQEVVIDLNAMLTGDEDALYAEGDDIIKVLFNVFGTGEVTLEEDTYFDIQYISFFPDVETAEGFEPSSQETYLKEYTGADVVYEEVTDEILDEYMSAADQKKEEIINSPNMDLSEVTGRCFYISNNGDDNNDGLSPETPWKTLQKLADSYSLLGINYTDIILFERGSVWREGIPVIANMRYSAYGEGEKPRFYRSVDGTGAENWEETDTENVWKYKYPIESDIGNIVFNEGECWGIKLVLDTTTGWTQEGAGMVTNGVDVFNSEPREYTGPDCIVNNLEYFHDVNGTQEVYLRCEWGNPGEYFDSLEMCKREEHVILESGTIFVTFDNLCFMYTGAHAVSTFGATGTTVQNCVFEWIGGSLQSNDGTTRFGNGFQNWGSCLNLTVKDCYMNQIYDSAITTQFSGENVSQVDGFTVTGNVIDRANTSVEFFNTGNSENYYKNVRVEDNYMRWAGFHFGHQRPAKNANFYSGSKGSDCPFYDSVFQNNVGIYCSRYAIASRALIKDMPVFSNNVYILSSERSNFSRSSGNIADSTGDLYLIPYQERYIKAIVTAGAEPGSKFYYYTGYLFPEEEQGVYYGIGFSNRN